MMKEACNTAREGARVRLPRRPLVGRLDDARLRGLVATPLGSRFALACQELIAKLNTARLVADPGRTADAMRMEARATCVGEASDEPYEVRLVYPWDAEVFGNVSIFSTLGIRLLGAVPGERFSVGGAWYRLASVATG